MQSIDLPEQRAGKIQTETTPTTVTYSGPDEKLTMNKYHLLWVIDRLQKKPKGPTIEHVLIPLAIFVGLLPALIAGEYQERLGIGPATWEALVIIVTIVALAATAILFIWWCARKCTQHKQTPEEVVNEILDKMAEDQRRLSGMKQPPDLNNKGSINALASR